MTRFLARAVGCAALILGAWGAMLVFASHSADLTGDGRVDQADLSALRSQWGQSGTSLSGDLTHNGTVNALDAGILFSQWGTLPAPPPPPPPPSPPPSPPPPITGCTRVLTGAVTLPRLDVSSSEVVCFDPAVTTTVTTSGNVIVRGILRMRPATPSVIHTLRFVNVDESRFVGGGMDPLETDVGVWVMPGGTLEAVGAAKTAWTRLSGAVSAGVSCFDVREAAGWQTGDEVVISATTPPGSPSDDTFWRTFDRRPVTSVSGNRICVGSGLTYNHPAVVAFGETFAAEVLNLTRNVKIEGTPLGRTHLFVRSDRPQTIRFVEIAYTGPRKVNPNDSRLFDPVLGRYGLHFHMMGDASRGSTVEGVVIRDSGSHAFVPHGSHGITFARTIAHDTLETAYWWDPGGSPHASHDIRYLDAVASYAKVFERFPGDIRNTRTSGFDFGRGRGNVGRGLVAVHNAFWGFNWPEGQSDDMTGEGVWLWEDGLAHNNRRGGIFTWQNTGNVHVVSRFTGFHQHKCIEHGAYANPYVYEGFRCFRSGPIQLHAIGSRTPDRPVGLTFRDGVVDVAGLFRAALTPIGYVFDGDVYFERVTWRGYTVAAVELTPFSNDETVRWHLQDNVFSGNELWIDAAAAPNHSVLFENTRLEARRRDQPGDYFEPRWNARVRRF